LKTRFLIDFLSSIPTHFDLFISMNYDSHQRLEIIMLQLLSTLKYMRFFTFNTLATKLCNVLTTICIRPFQKTFCRYLAWISMCATASSWFSRCSYFGTYSPAHKYLDIYYSMTKRISMNLVRLELLSNFLLTALPTKTHRLSKPSRGASTTGPSSFTRLRTVSKSQKTITNS
jgi:hypothetical protein